MFLPQPPSPPDSNLFRVFYSDPDLRVRRGQLFFLRANSKSMGWRNRKREGRGCKRNSGNLFPNETFINVRQTPHHENKSRPRQSVESRGVREGGTLVVIENVPRRPFRPNFWFLGQLEGLGGRGQGWDGRPRGCHAVRCPVLPMRIYGPSRSSSV